MSEVLAETLVGEGVLSRQLGGPSQWRQEEKMEVSVETERGSGRDIRREG